MAFPWLLTVNVLGLEEWEVVNQYFFTLFLRCSRNHASRFANGVWRIFLQKPVCHYVLAHNENNLLCV